MGFMPPFFSGSSAAPECVASSNSVVGSQQVPGSLLERESVRVVTTPGETESLWVHAHSPVGRRPVLEAKVLSRAHSRGKQPFCRFSSVSSCQALAMDDSAQALAEMPEWGVPLRFEA